MPYAELLRGRISIAGQIYLITTVTAARVPLFTDLRLGRAVVRALRAQDHSEGARTLAFVVMPNHCHWLLQMRERMDLSRVVKAAKGSSAREINLLRGSASPVWQRGFHDHALRAEEDVHAAARYVIANPIRAGLVRSLGDYALWDAVWL